MTDLRKEYEVYRLDCFRCGIPVGYTDGRTCQAKVCCLDCFNLIRKEEERIRNIGWQNKDAEVK